MWRQVVGETLFIYVNMIEVFPLLFVKTFQTTELSPPTQKKEI
jgi:hypothetical protein